MDELPPKLMPTIGGVKFTKSLNDATRTIFVAYHKRKYPGVDWEPLYEKMPVSEQIAWAHAAVALLEDVARHVGVQCEPSGPSPGATEIVPRA